MSKIENKIIKFFKFIFIVASIHFNRRERYAHVTFARNNSLFVLAGFNGFFLNDLFKFDLDKLRYFRNQEFKYLNTMKRLVVNTKTRRRRMGASFLSSLGDQSQAVDPIGDEEQEDSFGNKMHSRVKSHVASSSLLASPSIDFINSYESETMSKSKQTVAGWNGILNATMQNMLCNRFIDCTSCHLNGDCVWNSNTCEFYPSASR
jgi:hypothetical protein